MAQKRTRSKKARPSKPSKGQQAEVLAVIQESGILNPNLTLDNLIDASTRIERIIDIDTIAAWTFISPNYVYKGDQVRLTE